MAEPLSAFRISGAGTQQQRVEIVDQLLLPHSLKWEQVSTIDEAFAAIKSMKIRGAPAIASLATLGIASELLVLLSGKSSPSFPSSSLSDPQELLKLILSRSAYLLTSRPTAVNLHEALARIEVDAKKAMEGGCTGKELAERVVELGVEVWREDKERCEKIGNNGAKWILEKLEKEGSIEKGEKIAVLTVCNTGSLATSGYGTALGVIASLQQQGRLEHAYYAQTGPYQQGARLTSMELASLGTNNTMVCDTAIGALIAEKRVHLFVAGADRITANGDTANKVSTYQIALNCSSPHPFSPNSPIPVLVAAPVTTLDLNMASGKSIVIEQRPSWEACTIRGRVVQVEDMVMNKGVIPASANGAEEVEVATVLITPPNTRAWNPAFDVTPAKLISGIVTELGVASPEKSGEYDLKKHVAEGVKV